MPAVGRRLFLLHDIFVKVNLFQKIIKLLQTMKTPEQKSGDISVWKKCFACMYVN